VPLLLCPVLISALPDSIKFLVLRNPEDRRVAAILVKIAPEADPASVYVREQERVERQSVVELLSPSFRNRTLLLWCIFILNSFALYMLITWLPTLLTTAGWSNTQALRGAVMIQAGGIGGALMISWLIDRGKTVGALIGAYCAAAITLGLFSVVPSGAAWWLMLLIVGAGLSGAQGAFNILSALFYPASIRATGVGWAASASRVGAILSPLIGGLIVQQEFSAGSVMGMLVIPVAISAVGVMMIPRALRSVQETASC